MKVVYSNLSAKPNSNKTNVCNVVVWSENFVKYADAMTTGNFKVLSNPKKKKKPLKDQVKKGDALITNDPWIGAGHIFDFIVVSPIFYKSKIIGYFASTCHVVDVGGIGWSAEGKSFTFVSATSTVFPLELIIVIPKISSPGLGSTTFFSFSIEAA